MGPLLSHRKKGCRLEMASELLRRIVKHVKDNVVLASSKVYSKVEAHRQRDARLKSASTYQASLEVRIVYLQAVSRPAYQESKSQVRYRLFGFATYSERHCATRCRRCHQIVRTAC